MKTPKEILDKHTRDSQWYAPCCDNMIIAAMEEYARQYRMCALASENPCSEQCFTCSEDEMCDAKILKQRRIPISSCITCKKIYNHSEMYEAIGGYQCQLCAGL